MNLQYKSSTTLPFPELKSDNSIVLWHFNMSVLMGHFMPSPRERQKQDRRNSRREEKEIQRRMTEMQTIVEIQKK